MKNISKKLGAFLLVTILPVSVVVAPYVKAASEVTEEMVDKIIIDGIEASNEAMDNNGNPYAQLSELSEDNKVTVKMYDENYPIKSSNGDVYEDIIKVLVKKLSDNKDKVTSIESVKNPTGAGTITLSSLQGDDRDNSTIVQFILTLGLTGKDGNLKPAEGIGQLDGQSFQVKVKYGDNQEVTYTVDFKTMERVNEEDIDNIITEGIKASNEAMDNNGNPYAQLSELNSDNEVIVKMFDSNYPIKSADKNNVYDNIITVLVEKLFANKDKVTSIASVNDATGAGTINLDSLQGNSQDNGTIVKFILTLGLKGKDGTLQATGGIGQLDGQSFQVKVTDKDNEKFKTEVTYKVKFILFEELKLDNEATAEGDSKIKLDSSSKTVSGSDMSKGDSGNTASEVKAKFETISGANATIKIVNKDGSEIEGSLPVGTGYKVQLSKEGEVIDEVTIIVTGDVNGDAFINTDDAVKILDSIASPNDNKLEGVFETAAHFSLESELSTNDVVLLLDSVEKAKE